MLLSDCGEDTSVLERTAAAAILYNDPTDAVWCQIQAESSYADILKTVCGLAEDDRLYQSITDRVCCLKTDTTATIQEVAEH